MNIFLCGCSLDCSNTAENKITKYKFTTEMLSCFRYDSLDTFSCIIDTVLYNGVYAGTQYNRYESYRRGINPDCGEFEETRYDVRELIYFNSKNKYFLSAELGRGSLSNYIYVELDFYLQPTIPTINLYFSINDLKDTLTLNGKFYNDVFIQQEDNENRTIYYSKSAGLLKVMNGNKPVFQLQ